MPIRPENRDRYPDDWADIRESILERAVDDYVWASDADIELPRCECCGECGVPAGYHAAPDGRCPNYQHDTVMKSDGSGEYEVVLTVAHLDHQPENNDPANLRAMCQPCHLRYDAAHHAATAAQTRARRRRERLEAGGQKRLL